MSDYYRTFGAYLPQDRREELYGGRAVPQLGRGSVLFADIVGFTTLTTRMSRLYGRRRGAEEVLVYLNRVYDALTFEASRHGGSVIGFAGDAITCWFEEDNGRVAAYSGLAMQRAMTQFEGIELPGSAGSETLSLALKVAITVGRVRRFVVGDPEVQLIDVIAGGPVGQIEALERQMRKGLVVVSPEAAKTISRHLQVVPADGADEDDVQAAWLDAAADGLIDAPDQEVGPAQRGEGGDAQVSRWLLPTVRRRLASGGGHFLTELRPVAALFLSFDGIDLDSDDEAPAKFDAVVQSAQRVAQDYGGNVLQVTSGDKGNYLFTAFGAPVSHEDDVARCAAAALELRSALLQLDFLDKVTIGLGHGTARTGAYGAEARRTYGALGEGTNMAARMMSAAPHGHIYASGEFTDAAGHGFRFTAVAGLKVKGRDGAVRAFELVGRAEGTSFTGTAPLSAASGRVGGTAGLPGREVELRALRSSIAQAVAGRGGAVQLVAEAGMGKTELLRHALAEGDALWVVRGACQAFGRTAPYQLWKSVFHQLLGVSERLPAGDRMAAVERSLARIDAALASQAYLLAPVLDLGVAPEAEGAQAAEERDAARRRLMLTLFREVARATFKGGLPLVLVLEDLHWLDPASEELLKAVGQAAFALPMLLLTTARPAEATGESPAGSLAGATVLELGLLAPDVAGEVVGARLAAVPQLGRQLGALSEAIARRAGGNPFYLQELINDVLLKVQSLDLEAGATPDRSGAAVPEPLPDLVSDLPTSVHSLILGRLDRLQDDHLVSLKVASIVGREFRTSWVAACRSAAPDAPGVAAAAAEATAVGSDDARKPSPAPPAGHVETAAELAAEDAFRATGQVGLTTRLTEVPSSHEFNHAITHEVAYGSQAYADRTRLHTALARFIERGVATPEEPHLDLLAYHYSLGEDLDKARHYLGAAGAAAKAAYANQAALDYFGRLLALQTGSERLPTLLELGEVASFVGAYAGAERHLGEALESARTTADHATEAVALRLLGELYERQGDHTKARSPLEQAAELCRRTVNGEAELTRALLALGGNVLWHLGEYDAAEAQLDEAVRLARAAGDVRAAARALHGKANIYLYRGQSAEAEAAFSESLAMRRAANDEYGVAQALNNLAIVYAGAGDGARAEELFAESLAIRQRLGDSPGVAVALNNLGYMAAERGDLEGARRLYEESLATRRDLGDRLGLAVSLNNLAGLLLGLGDVDEAREHYAESLRLACSIDNRREAAAALAGLSNAVTDDASGARMALIAERLLELLGAAVDEEVRAHIDKGKARGAGTTGRAAGGGKADGVRADTTRPRQHEDLQTAEAVPDLAALTLTEAVHWALGPK